MTSPKGQDQVSASLDPEVALALERLVIHTAMEDAQVALECEAILKRALSTPPPAVSEVREAVDWRTMETVPGPHDPPFIAALRVFSKGEFLRWESHYIALNDETGEIDNDFEQGWRLEDYEVWAPVPVPSGLALPLPRMGEGISLSQSQPSGDPGPLPRPAGEAGDAGLVERLRAKDHAPPFDPKAVYRTRPVALYEEAADAIERLTDKVEGLDADLYCAVEVAYKRGATEWTRLNYREWFERLSAPHSNGEGET